MRSLRGYAASWEPRKERYPWRGGDWAMWWSLPPCQTRQAPVPVMEMPSASSSTLEFSIDLKVLAPLLQLMRRVMCICISKAPREISIEARQHDPGNRGITVCQWIRKPSHRPEGSPRGITGNTPAAAEGAVELCPPAYTQGSHSQSEQKNHAGRIATSPTFLHKSTAESHSHLSERTVACPCISIRKATG